MRAATVLRLRRGVGLAAALSLGLATGSPSAGSLRVDPTRSQLVVRTFKDGLAARLAHDHVVQATELSGTVEYDPAQPGAATIMVEAQAASLRVDEPALRQRFGLTGEPSASDRTDIEKAMRSPGQLDVTRFPTVRFASTRIALEADGRHAVIGILTIRGVSRTVSFAAEVTPDGGGWRCRASLTFKQSDFGYQPYSALLGAIKNQDQVTLHVDLVAGP